MPTIDVLDSTIHYEDTGSGTPIVFLHGNPTSSHIWRNVLPRIGEPGRCLAPDMIGMGKSGKPDIAYTFDDQSRYVEAWFEAVGIDEAILVGIDWGGPILFDWATRHPGRTRAIAFMETLVRPMSWSEFPEVARDRFQGYRTRGVGETAVLEQNAFIQAALKATVMTPLAEEDRDAYLAPYPTPESRRPMLAWPRAWPLDGEPADVTARFDAFGAWLRESDDVPKLLLTFDTSQTLVMPPGSPLVEWCRANVSSLEIEGCGAAAHMAPEDRPEEIAAAIHGWLDRHELR
jgi:haloalkane dehalogenase